MTCHYCNQEKFVGFWWRLVWTLSAVLGGLKMCGYHAEYWRERDRIRRERARADARRDAG